jgi:hypothetical protein
MSDNRMTEIGLLVFPGIENFGNGNAHFSGFPGTGTGIIAIILNKKIINELQHFTHLRSFFLFMLEEII